jgi:hypothetical protein
VAAKTKRLYAAEKKEIKITGSLIHKEEAKALTISKISPKRFNEKGPAKFIINSKNHSMVKIGATLSPPLLIRSLRECLCSYIMFTPANSPEDTKPCASMTHHTPCSLSPSALNRLKITSAI